MCVDTSPPPPPAADRYLLQIQQYIMPGSGASKEGGEEAWHDVDIVKTTVYTVTGYQIPKDPTVKATEVCCHCRLQLGERELTIFIA